MTGHRILRRSLRMLTEGRPLRVGRGRRREAAALQQEHAHWMNSPGVQGVGISHRETGGVVRNEVTLTVYVERKVPLADCTPPVPKEISLPGLSTVVRPDVKEIGRVRPLGYPGEHRPAFPGVSVGVPGAEPGTLGCWVRRPGHETNYLLSASHVIANLGDGPVGEPVYQPEEGEAPEPIGSLEDWVEFKDGPELYPNRVDAAMAAVADDSSVSNSIPGIGVPAGSSLYLRKGMKVRKVGVTTGYSEGRILDTDFCEVLRFDHPAGGTRDIGFRSLVVTSMKCRPGDSGAAVFSSSGKVIGLVLAGSATACVFCRIGPALAGLKVYVMTRPDP